MTTRSEGLIEYTASLAWPELQQLTLEADYVLQFTVTSELESDYADFEGGDCWVFDQYRISIEKQFFPAQQVADTPDDRLALPGRKQGESGGARPRIGSSYIAFYRYSAMARGFSLEGLLAATDANRAQIEHFIQSKG